MGRPCTICTRSDVDAVDAALVEGASYRRVSRRFGVSMDAARRHSDAHLSVNLAAVSSERDRVRAEKLTDRVERLIGRVERVAADAEASGKVGPLLASTRELRSLLELLGKATGELKPDGGVTVAVNVAESPEWAAIRGAVFRALAEHPAARAAVAAELSTVSALPVGGST